MNSDDTYSTSGDALPHCDEIFKRYWDRWYDDEDRKAKTYTATRPDLVQLKDEPTTLSALSRLSPEYREKVLKQIERMFQAAQGDWPSYLQVAGPPTLEWIKSFDAYYDPQHIQALLNRSDPEQDGNDYMIVCIEFSVVLGTLLRHREASLAWVPEWPYWESYLWHPASSTQVHVFSWAVKKLSSYGWDDGFAEKIEVCVQMLRDRA
ncbi:MAG: hypothetical protein M5U26_18995 [Planctomycetota bacterium]|nr:hypothetical protein [Planctomycetota bacterium]